jgi:hypothetical protein
MESILKVVGPWVTRRVTYRNGSINATLEIFAETLGEARLFDE